MTLCN